MTGASTKVIGAALFWCGKMLGASLETKRKAMERALVYW
jgi:hypothetical protein